MKITRIETIPIRMTVNPRIAIKSGRGAHNFSPFLIVKIYTDAEHVGLGEVSCTPRWSGEDQVTAKHFIDTYFAPLLVGEPLVGVADIERLTERFTYPVALNPFTKAGVEMALWDLAGKLAGVPVYQLLGGRVREFVPTKFSITGAEPARAAEIAKAAFDSGFKKMKVKTGIDPDSDVARVAAVRLAVGPDAKIGVDANGGWPDAKTAIATVARLRASNIYFVEQPVPTRDIDGLAEVRRACGLPVMADESVYSLQDAKAIARAKAADIFSIYIGKAGGIGPARAIADFAQTQNISCTIGSNLEMGIASAAMTHLALSTRAIDAETYPCDIIGPLYYEDDILREPLPVVPGSARVHERPGLGVELDDAKVEKYRVR